MSDDAAPALPERLPYRLLTGTTDRAFCERISEALLDGYVLHGSPVMAFDGEQVVTGQVVVLPSVATTDGE